MLVDYKAHSPGHVVADGAELLVCSGMAFWGESSGWGPSSSTRLEAVTLLCMKAVLDIPDDVRGDSLFLLYFCLSNLQIII